MEDEVLEMEMDMELGFESLRMGLREMAEREVAAVMDHEDQHEGPQDRAAVEDDDEEEEDDEEEDEDDDEDEEEEDDAEAYGEDMVIDGPQQEEDDEFVALIRGGGNGNSGNQEAFVWSEENRISVIRSLFPSLGLEEAQSALRWVGGDLEMADALLRELNVVAVQGQYTTEIAFPRPPSGPAFRQVSDESLTVLVATGFSTQLAAAALRRYTRVEEAAAWILDRGEAEGLAAIASDEAELNTRDASQAMTAVMTAKASLAPIPETALKKLHSKPQAAGLQHNLMHGQKQTTSTQSTDWCPSCCKELSKTDLRCSACRLCESCLGTVHCCPGLFNGCQAHRHALTLVRGPRHTDRYCDVQKSGKCGGAHCVWSWRCQQCDFDVCVECIRLPLDKDWRSQQRLGGVSGPGRFVAGRRARAAAAAAAIQDQAIQQPPVFAVTASRSSKLSGTVRGVDPAALDDEIAARWAGRSTLFEVSSFLKRRKAMSQQVVGLGIVGASSIEAGRSRKKRKLNLPLATTLRNTKTSTERQLRREERLVLADFYNNTHHRSACALALAESMLSQSNTLDVAGRRGIEAALASGDLSSAGQLLVGSNALYRRLESTRKRHHAKLIRDFKLSGQQQQSLSQKQTETSYTDNDESDDDPVCAVCYGDLNENAVYCLGISATSTGSNRQHGLHAACAADLLLGGGDCPRCREPLFHARLDSVEADEAARLAHLRLKARCERLHFRIGDAVSVIDAEKKFETLQTPATGGFQPDMLRYCGVQGIILSHRDAGTMSASADVQFYDGVTLRISAAALRLTGSAPTPRLSSGADDTSHFAAECSDRLREELVAVRRARDVFLPVVPTSTHEIIIPRTPTEEKRKARLQKIVDDLQIADKVHTIDVNGLDTAARTIRRECLRRAYDHSAWLDAQKLGRYRVATGCFLDLRASPKTNAPRTGFRLAPGACFSAEKELLDDQGRWWIKLSTTPNPIQSKKKSWRKGDPVDAALHLPQAVGAKVIRGNDFKATEHPGDLGPYAEILGSDRKRSGNVRVRWIGAIPSATGILASSLERKHRAGGEHTKKYELVFASDAPPAQPPPQGWLQARLNGPGTPLAVRRVQRTLRCFACGDDLCFDDASEDKPAATPLLHHLLLPEMNTVSSCFKTGDYAMVKATLERVQVMAINPEQGLACRFVSIPALNTSNDLFTFRDDDLLPVASEDQKHKAETRREMVLRLGLKRAQEQRLQIEPPQLPSCIFGHAMHPRCFQGRLAAGEGCPACAEPLWFPPRAIEPSDDTCCNTMRTNRQDNSTTHQFVEIQVLSPETATWRLEVSADSDLILTITKASDDSKTSALDTHEDDEDDENTTKKKMIITGIDIEPAGDDRNIGALACTLKNGDIVRSTVELRPQRNRMERLMEIATRCQVIIESAYIDLPGELSPQEAPQENIQPPPGGGGLRMCPVCCAGPLANEQCSDLRAHHSQCPRCQIKIPNADTRIAEALSAISSGRGPATVGECIPKCPTCKVAVIFNGCLECGKLYHNMSWDSLPKWDPNAKRKLEKAQRDRNQMRALALQVRREAAFLSHEKAHLKLLPNSQDVLPLPGTTAFGTPPAYTEEVRHSLKIACDDECSRRHVNGLCLVCGLDWGEHSGHSCPDGQRGSWVIDFNDEDDNNNDIFE